MDQLAPFIVRAGIRPNQGVDGSGTARVNARVNMVEWRSSAGDRGERVQLASAAQRGVEAAVGCVDGIRGEAGKRENRSYCGIPTFSISNTRR